MIKAIDANMYLYLFVENIAPIQNEISPDKEKVATIELEKID